MQKYQGNYFFYRGDPAEMLQLAVPKYVWQASRLVTGGSVALLGELGLR